MKNGGENLMLVLAMLLDDFRSNCCVPQEMKKGVIIPIPKAGSDSTICNNNRGIVLLPVIFKLYQKVIQKRWSPLLENMGAVDTLQGAGSKGKSCLHTSLIMREVMTIGRAEKLDLKS